MSGKITQKETNPYKYSYTNKRYRTYDSYLRERFGGKVAKVALDAGFTCPNIDGRCGYGGCIYCSGRGSGDFAPSSLLSIEEQYEAQRRMMSGKWETVRTIPYLQAHTNTYGDINRLREVYYRALGLDGAVGLNIATRADCLSEEVLLLLEEIAEKTFLTVELGLQTVHDKTARLINRGHSYGDFLSGYYSLKAIPNINIGVHLIFGLPEENREMMLKTAEEVAKLRPHQVKLHFLYVQKDTALAKMYLEGKYTPLELEEYVSLACDAIELLPEDTVIGRLTGDAPQKELLAPMWSKKKLVVMNEIDKELFRRGSYQGIRYKENCVDEDK